MHAKRGRLVALLFRGGGAHFYSDLAFFCVEIRTGTVSTHKGGGHKVQALRLTAYFCVLPPLHPEIG